MNAFVKPIIICEPVILQLNHLFFLYCKRYQLVLKY